MAAIIIVLTYNSLQTCIQKLLGILLLVVWNSIEVIKKSELFNGVLNIICKHHAMQMTLMYHNLMSIDHCACGTALPIWWPLLGCTSVTQIYVNVSINLYDTFLDTFTKLRKATVGFIMPVCLSAPPSAWNSLVPTGQIFMKFDISVFLANLSSKVKFHYNLTRITGTWHEDQYTFLIVPRSVLQRIKNVSHKSCREN